MVSGIQLFVAGDKIVLAYPLPFQNSTNDSIGLERRFENGIETQQCKPLPRNNALAESLSVINKG
jgi:hypothetical protein